MGRLLATITIAMVLCSACLGPDSPTASRATPAGVATLRPWSTPEPSPTATPSPSTAPSPTSPCLAVVTPAATHQSTRPLRVVYSDGSQLWLWREETDQASPLAANLRGGFLSPDGQLVAFWRQLDAQRDEIWVVGTDGRGERRLAVSDGREISERHPEFAHVQTALRMGWVPNTRILWYCRVFDAFDTGVPPYGETVRLVDADSGAEPRVIVPPGDVWVLAFAPDGRQVAALTEHELRLIDVADGRVAHVVPFATNSTYRQEILYTADGGQVLVYVRNALAFVDTASGQRRDIPLDYEPIGWGHGSTFPPICWLDEGLLAYAVVTQGSYVLDVWKPEATFAVWRLDLSQGTATRLRTYSGMGTEARFSPDCRWLAYSRFVDQNSRELYLTDVESGRQVLYDRGDVALRSWHPNSIQFAYGGLTSSLRVGQLCGPPMQVGQADDRLSHSRALYLIGGRDDFLTVGPGPGDTYLIGLSTFSGQTRRIANPKRRKGDVWVGCFLGD